MTEQLGTTVSRLPVLPLRGLVAFPNMIIHFDVGRLLSIRALEAAMKNGQTLFLTAQRDLKTDNPSPSDLYQIGTICQVKQILRLPGDNIRVLVEGKQRALVHQFFAAQDDKTCIYAEVEQLEDYVYGVTERRAQALVRTAQERFAEYADNAQRISPDVELTVAEGGDAGFLADYIAQNISIEVAAKQDILEELSITRRLTMVIRLLGEETEVLRLENEIQDEVKSQMDKNQREYYLREQIKVIQTELGEQDERRRPRPTVSASSTSSCRRNARKSSSARWIASPSSAARTRSRASCAPISIPCSICRGAAGAKSASISRRRSASSTATTTA